MLKHPQHSLVVAATIDDKCHNHLLSLCQVDKVVTLSVEVKSHGARQVDKEGRVHFLLAARGLPHARRKSEALWDRAIKAVEVLKKDPHGVAGLESPPWLKTAEMDLQALSDQGRAGLTSLARQILKALSEDPAKLSRENLWTPFVMSGLCMARAADAVSETEEMDALRSEKPGRIETTCWSAVKEQGSQPYKDGRLVYHHLKQCDEVFHFRLAELVVEDKEVRTLVEGLWCLILGTFQYKEAWMALRRRFGLVNVGEQVKGDNSTHCSDKPRAERAGETGEHGLQDREWQAYKCRVWNLRHLASGRRAAGQGRQAEDFLNIIKISQAAIRTHLGKVIVKGELAYRPPPPDKDSKERSSG
ncbi:hypothetical protein BCV69DRAFT_299984 [Microstroma glucosiphilum]|uniref:Uncharacterized protein n=1 Tax=Pseudomicrostroma glucosiphilum TaxID=1684307 RepID=A0A316U4G0_9BASI|nr:hypothetical protein BCV69DRAFT_299984 [Pseudomicrostroma glucosiphilum]PWN19674.1 hypothetical protein BCV69DRAFT_299984 [Pseudomicrostroma glucosiphilum]